MHTNFKAIGCRFLASLCLAAIVWGIGLPFSADIFLLSGVFLLAMRLPARKTVLIIASVLVALALGEASLRLMVRHNKLTTTYRLDDKYGEKGHYRPNVRDAMTMRFGDIAAMDPLAPTAARETRQVRFVTDDFGFRNDRGYQGQRFVLVGDSFVAGTDTDQPDILGNVLRTDFGLDTYSLGFPGNPDDYLGYARRFLDEKSRDVRFVLFIFEGNDLSCSSKQRKKFDPADLPAYDQWKLRYVKAVGDVAMLPMTVFNMALQIKNMYFTDSDAFSETYKIGKRYVSFYGPYIDAALFEHCSFKFDRPDEEVLSKVAMFFFIPAKYRVYGDRLEGPWARTLPRPSSGFESLRQYGEAHGIATVDLTPALTEAAQRLLPQGEYVFWRDDTHWNPAGIRAAAAVVAQKLRALPEAGKQP